MLSHQRNGSRGEQSIFMNAVTACVNKAVTEGYSECFKITSRGLYAISKSRYYRPEQVQLIDTYSCGTQSGPAAEQALIYAIQTSDGLKGTLIDNPAGCSEASVNTFIQEAQEIRKQFLRHDQHQC